MMNPSRFIQFSILFISLLFVEAFGQNVYERGTFVSIPAGKHVNHSFYSTWNVYFAVEDGVLVYDHHKREWLEPITASDGLSQYPVLLVWQNAVTQDVWMVTPDYVFVYDELSAWMEKAPLPVDPKFSGAYELGISDANVIVTAASPDYDGKYSALFSKTSGSYDVWGANSDLEVKWEKVDWIQPISEDLNKIYDDLPVLTVAGGSFDTDRRLHLDGRPKNTRGEVSSLAGASAPGEVFLSTYGMGIFYQHLPGGEFISLPYGLLSPDVMSMSVYQDKLLIGGRAGLTYMDSSSFAYDEAIEEMAFDYSFITDITTAKQNIIIAGRDGIFSTSTNNSAWDRVITKKDLVSNRIYSIAAGHDGNIMVATERNAYLYHDSGQQLDKLFPDNLDWPVFDIYYSDGKYYISSYYGLYIYSEKTLSFIGRVNSSGNFLSVGEESAIDPVYKCVVVGDNLWTSTHRGLMYNNLLTREGGFQLAPNAPFKPRGLASAGKRIWVGTDMGLYSYDTKSSTWRIYTSTDGLISNFVTDLITKDGYIWVGTNLGLTRIKWKKLY